jgi:hypothetical protein
MNSNWTKFIMVAILTIQFWTNFGLIVPNFSYSFDIFDMISDLTSLAA